MSNRINTGADAIYDSGFTSHASRSNVKLERDADVIKLYQAQIATPSILENWNYKERVLQVAARLMFPLAPWVMAQRSNTMHSKHSLLFVRDIAKVALGESRDMSVNTRMNLMMDSAVTSNPLELRGDIDKLDRYIPMSIVERLRTEEPGRALANLTATPELLRELVQSLYVMFGTGR